MNQCLLPEISPERRGVKPGANKHGRVSEPNPEYNHRPKVPRLGDLGGKTLEV